MANISQYGQIQDYFFKYQQYFNDFSSVHKIPFFGLSLNGWAPILGGTFLLFSDTTAAPIPPITPLIQLMNLAKGDSTSRF
ncbi:hypothetical protein [Prochlorococcus sp. MIT 1306]|uniref:hypothetical protein n=1 Tax=Prochlorococcus sp. MIT 1306 TaxID=1799667 RepID=UPI0012E8C931|nr:hypothetical protein [Prochlorococcus sp. MIT 1306]